MQRVILGFNEDELKELDRVAEAKGMTRAAFVRQAVTHYRETLNKGQQEAERRQRMQEACRKMDKLAEKLGDWDPVSIIRFYRDTRYGPQWWKTRTHPIYPGPRKAAKR